MKQRKKLRRKASPLEAKQDFFTANYANLREFIYKALPEKLRSKKRCDDVTENFEAKRWLKRGGKILFATALAEGISFLFVVTTTWSSFFLLEKKLKSSLTAQKKV